MLDTTQTHQQILDRQPANRRPSQQAALTAASANPFAPAISDAASVVVREAPQHVAARRTQSAQAPAAAYGLD